MRRLPALSLIMAACGPSIVNCPPNHYRSEDGACIPGEVDTGRPGDDDDDDNGGDDLDGDGWSTPQDCDDGNANVNPEATEVDGNGIDDDCDRSIDEREHSQLDRVVDGDSARLCDDPSVAQAYATPGARYLPLTVVRVGTSDAEDLPSLPMVEAAIEAANEVLATAGLEAFVGRAEVLYDSDFHQVQASTFASLRDQLDEDGTLHVFVVDTVTDADGAPTDGLAAVPGSQRPHGLVIAADALELDRSLAHLIGHALGLDHTHAGADGASPESVSGDNCKTAGDRLCDTLADPGPSWAFPDGCAVDAGTCAVSDCGFDSKGDPFAPDIGNPMSAYPDDCGEGAFTTEQSALMRCAAAEDLPGLALTVEPTLAPVVQITGFTIDDDLPGPSEGDNDGLFEAGETIELTVDLRNSGAEAATGVSAQLTGATAPLQISVATDNVGTIGINGTNTASFVLSVPIGCTADLDADLDLTFIDDAGGTWTDTITVPVDCTGIVDLEAVSADVQGNALRPGTDATFDLAIRNDSLGALAGVEVDLYLSLDGTIDPSDTFLCRLEDPGSISAGATKSFSTDCRVPAGLTGTGWRFGFLVDPDDVFVEADETNNDVIDPASPSIWMPSNLTISNVSLSPTVLRAGDDITVTYTRENDGAGDAAAFDIDVYLSTDGTITSADTLLCTIGVPGGMTAGATAVRMATCTVPPSAPLGSYTVGVIIDEPDAIEESNENDNVAVAPTPLVVASDIDLELTHVDFIDVQGFPGDTVELDFRMENTGSDDAQDFYVGVLFSTDGVLTSADYEACRTTSPLDLNAGAVSALTLTGCPVPDLPRGTYTVGVYLDSSTVVDETNEANNLLADTTSFTIQGIDLTVHDVAPLTASGAAGSAVDVGYIRENLGNADAGAFRLGIRWSTNATIDASDPQGCFVDIGNSPAGDLADVFLNCTVPAGLAPGNYYVGVMIDGLEAVAEDDETNNIAVAPTLFTVN